MSFSSKKYAVGMLSVSGMLAAAASVQAATVVDSAPFGNPSILYIEGPGTQMDPSGEWYASDSQLINLNVGPSQFHPSWGTLTAVELTIVAGGEFDWDVSNPTWWWLMDSTGVWASVDVGGLAGDSDLDQPDPFVGMGSDSGTLSLSGYYNNTYTSSLSSFIGTGAYTLPLSMNIAYHVQSMDVNPSGDPLAALSGSMTGEFYGSVTVKYTYDPTPGRAVPEPGSALLVGMTGCVLACRRTSRRPQAI